MLISTDTFFDPDGRSFCGEFFKKEDGAFKAYLETCPWPEASMKAFTNQQTHLDNVGNKRQICLSKNSICDLDVAKKRAAFWCTGFSFLMEHGYSATKAAISDW